MSKDQKYDLVTLAIGTGIGACLMFLAFAAYFNFVEEEPVAEVRRLTCFSMNGQLRVNVVEHNLRFEQDVIRFSNSKGQYAIYPQEGWLCSIVSEK